MNMPLHIPARCALAVFSALLLVACGRDAARTPLPEQTLSMASTSTLTVVIPTPTVTSSPIPTAAEAALIASSTPTEGATLLPTVRATSAATLTASVTMIVLTPQPSPSAIPAIVLPPSPSLPDLPTPRPSLPTATPGPLWKPGGQEASERLGRYTNGLRGALVERLFFSSALGRDMPYNIYLPPGYETSDQRYPVLYMLHGGGGHRDEWLGYDLIYAADPAISNGVIRPMIIVMPQGDTGYWANNPDNGPRWGDYLWRDVVTHIDAAYRTVRSPQARAVGGNSMGGWGGLSNSFLHPDVFGVVGAHSPSLPLDDGTRPMLGTGAHYKGYDPIYLAETATKLDMLKIWIDCGQDDSWLPRVTLLHRALSDRGVNHIWQVKPGDHDYTYWMARIPDYLRFYSDALVH